MDQMTKRSSDRGLGKRWRSLFLFVVVMVFFSLLEFPCDFKGHMYDGDDKRQKHQNLGDRHPTSLLPPKASGEITSKAALLTPASLWSEFAEPVRTQSRLAFWVNALTAEAALTAYHKTRIFATKTPGSAPVRAAGSFAFLQTVSAPQCQLAQNSARKFGRRFC
jgi:hypothetical protein